MEGKVIARVKFADNTLYGLNKALAAIGIACRNAIDGEKGWMGMSTTAVENADGFNPHSLELIEEIMSDSDKAYTVRFLFCGDV